MPRYVAFLRAINVGGRVVKMDRLRSLFEEMTFGHVETFIASGNVIFDAPARGTKALTKRIESELRESLGYEVATFLRTIPELRRIAELKPFGDDGEDARSYIGFLTAMPTREAQRKVLVHATSDDELHFDGTEFYWLRRASILESKLSGPMLEKSLGMAATLRNSNTVRKLADKYC